MTSNYLRQYIAGCAYWRKYMTLSNQTSRYKSKCIRMQYVPKCAGVPRGTTGLKLDLTLFYIHTLCMSAVKALSRHALRKLALKPRSHCPGLRCRFTPVWWSGMNRDEPCHNRGGTVDNLGDPGWTVLNRLMSPVVLKCFKQPGLTGSNREGCQIPW